MDEEEEEEESKQERKDGGGKEVWYRTSTKGLNNSLPKGINGKSWTKHAVGQNGIIYGLDKTPLQKMCV